MRLPLIGGLGGLGLLAGLLGPMKAQEQPADKPPAGIVVVELFTSEGCSSCPAADKLLAETLKRERAAGHRVLALGFHVDYWNQLGHPDRFSDAKYTTRQEAYAGRLSPGNMYTPQMVVNGGSAFIGSDERKLKEAVDDALDDGKVLALTPEVRWAAEVATESAKGADKQEPGTVHVSFALPAALKDRAVRVFAVWVEDGLKTDVKRGENAGHVLQHDAVVRALGEGEVKDGRASVELTPPLDVDRAKSSIVVLVQEGREGVGQMLGAGFVRAVAETR